MIAVVLLPNSVTNSSDKYRVVWDGDWMHYANGARSSYAYTAYDTYDEAAAARDTMNVESNDNDSSKG